MAFLGSGRLYVLVRILTSLVPPSAVSVRGHTTHHEELLKMMVPLVVGGLQER